MADILKIVKSLEDSGILLKGISKTIKNEAKEQKGGFLGTLLGTLGASLLENMLAGKGFKEQEKELLKLSMDRKSLHLNFFFDSITSFNKLLNTNVLSK